MSSPVSSLPDAWIERIWATLRATYGAAFDRQWQPPADVSPADHVAALKAVWGRQLATLQQNPKAIAYALDNLPDSPPNLAQFKALCARRPTELPLALPRPAPDPERVAQALSRFERPKERDPKAWAWALREREERGERLTLFQREAWRTALRAEVDAERAEHEEART